MTADQNAFFEKMKQIYNQYESHILQSAEKPGESDSINKVQTQLQNDEAITPIIPHIIVFLKTKADTLVENMIGAPHGQDLIIETLRFCILHPQYKVEDSF